MHLSGIQSRERVAHPTHPLPLLHLLSLPLAFVSHASAALLRPPLISIASAASSTTSPTDNTAFTFEDLPQDLRRECLSWALKRVGREGDEEGKFIDNAAYSSLVLVRMREYNRKHPSTLQKSKFQAVL
jgi:hypothetical protein